MNALPSTQGPGNTVHLCQYTSTVQRVVLFRQEHQEQRQQRGYQPGTAVSWLRISFHIVECDCRVSGFSKAFANLQSHTYAPTWRCRQRRMLWEQQQQLEQQEQAGTMTMWSESSRRATACVM